MDQQQIFSIMASSGASIFIDNFVVALGIALICHILLRFGLMWRIQNAQPGWKHYVNESFYALRSMGVWLLLAVATVYLHINHIATFDTGPAPALPVLIGQIIFLVVLHDTYFYWMHRLYHTKLFYKHVHAKHHETHQPVALTGMRYSVAEAFLSGIFYILVMCVVTLHVTAYAFDILLIAIINAIGHAGMQLKVQWRYRRFWPWMNLPTYHDYHHSTNQRCNYGLYFTFWDKLMGTDTYDMEHEGAKSSTAPN